MGHPMAATPDPSFAQTIERHLPTVWNFCSRMTLSTSDAKEATYESFERAADGLLDELMKVQAALAPLRS